MSHYCYLCGHLLTLRLIEGREREFCESCGWIHYQQWKISAGVRVQKEGKLLLAQRRIEPWSGCWYLPAGFVEADEPPDQAAVRETHEETGLRVQVKGLAGLYPYTDDPRGNGIVLLYEAEIVGGEFKSSIETIQSGFYAPGEIEKMPLAGLCAQKQVHDWVKGLKTTKDDAA
ncbi:MAG: NUDIX hydrolase [Chloroflexi bacterium]|nr:NUDIX hydrolase [Chloroflexota bacterium]